MPGTFNPRRFLSLGIKLSRDKKYDEDCRARTAISRIYYAAFLVALNKMIKAGIKIRDNSKIHREVINTYMENGYTDIGDKLDQMRERRVDADYNMLSDISVAECQYYSRISQRTITLIGTISSFNRS